MKLECLSGVGNKTALLLNKLNIYTVEDLLTHYPYKYNFIHLKKLEEIHNDENVYISIKIASIAKVAYIKKNFNIMTFQGVIDDNVINVKIFNRAFMKQNLSLNKNVVLVGKYDKIKNIFVASDIKFNINNNTIEPIYHLTEGIKNNLLIKLIDVALNSDYHAYDLVPEEYNEKYEFIDKNLALDYIHQPSNIEEIKKAKLKLIYEELFNYMFKINVLKINNKKQKGIKHIFDKELIYKFLSDLPFKLTEEQLTTIEEILVDLESDTRMNRLVLGDVGSGKTMVAMVGILANYYSGYQASFMAPTEILAKQHYESISNYFNELEIKVEILTGSTTKKNKEKIYEGIKNGDIDLIVGTHSLINEQVVFSRLGLVITDEQHLFGVKQRNALNDKGSEFPPDVLYLSATPIPRSYALTIYGDLSLSMIRTKPKMRKEIITQVKKESEIRDVLQAMLREIKLNHQIFVVSPLIEQNEELDLNSVLLLQEKLNDAFNNVVPIEIVHGKMKPKDKDSIMNDFASGKIKVLISTTVIEVGIDIPNATMMVIFNAERFGLATLHQLRGRVGRNDLQSYCYLISNHDNERLKVMEESSDGFYISEKDFEQRGQGDLFGVKQSGDVIFKLADFKEHSKILLQANKDAEEYINSRKYLENIYYKNVFEDIKFLD